MPIEQNQQRHTHLHCPVIRRIEQGDLLQGFDFMDVVAGVVRRFGAGAP